QVARLADSLGYPGLWIGEMATFDAFALATAIALQTEKIALTIGPLAVAVRTPMTMAMGAASVADLGGRDVSLAIGASSVVVVEQWHGRQRARTARHLEETAQILQPLLRGEKVDIQGELAACRGYRLRLDGPGDALTIAAFGPAAVKVAARHAARMLLNMVTPQSLAQLRAGMEQAAAAAQRPAPALAVWLPCAVDPTPESIEQMKRAVVGYLAAPGYSDMMCAAGFSELVEFARTRPHPGELLAAMPDELVSTVGLVGSAADIESRVQQYRAAGADEICLVPATAGDDAGGRSLRAMRGYCD
ncbi:MAG: LLM class F420-dependent oxidoreductase, partial [Halioglobus sp.]|nr:LLM class F420-dependent oxidoreductase [Halioglobus sp.]